MMDRESLSLLGLSEQKIDETLRNESLSDLLIHISKEATKNGPISKASGIFLYKLGTKLPKLLHDHLYILVEYVAKEKINHDAKLFAAINYFKVKYQPSVGINISEFEEFCGIGKEVTADEIEDAIKNIMLQNKDKILLDRYSFNVGPLIGKVTVDLKWADSKKVKEEFDIQMLSYLGAKTDEDYAKLKSKKAKVTNNEQKLLHDMKISCASEPEKQISMEEFLKTVHFHAPGENFKTEGYVVTANTHDLLKQHLKETNGKVICRFPPEPNGILHIGHAKAININFGYAAANNGVCLLRYDDTNPEKEEEKFFSEIKNMVEWLGYEPYRITHSSDYFDILYKWAEKLVTLNLAYVCHQKAEEIKGRDQPPSPWRNRPIEESLMLFRQMSMGIFDEGEATLRLKLTLEEGKVDPIAYRIKFVSHHRSKDKWCIYPTYDYTHCLCDSLENITHSLCTKEFQSRRSSYYWLCNALGIYCPVQWEYGRLNVNYTVVSKRKIKNLIDMEMVRDWDDPRLFTLTALKRRGVPAEAINNFCATLGLTGAQTAIHPDALDHCVRDYLNTTVNRAMVTLEPLEIEIVNFPHDSIKIISVPNIPGNEKAGEHEISLDKVIYIEQADFRETEEKLYRRLTMKQPVGLRHCGLVIEVDSLVHDDAGKIKKIKALCKPATKDNKPKAFIHWVSNPMKCEVRLYDKLFNHENPEDTAIVPGGFVSDINPYSIKVITDALIDVSVKSAQIFDKFQFERVGFFSVDPDSTNQNLVFNRTVCLKEDKGKS